MAKQSSAYFFNFCLTNLLIFVHAQASVKIPTNKVSSASVVLHLYYQFLGKNPHNCDFSGNGITIYKDRCSYWDQNISIVLKKFTSI
ncbi:hypothetical protein ACOSP7_028715 [Xanthoceras sorbifolium]